MHHHSHKETWLFDLDNTLHNASRHIFPRISQLMMAYICEELHVSEEEARLLRQTYWKKYGATMLGLMRHHNTDPEDFLKRTHNLPNIEKLVVAERSLKKMLNRLSGNKILFSNAPEQYVESVLNALGITNCFDSVYSVEKLKFQPKPALKGFLHLLHQERLTPKYCTMVEDTLPNLQMAKKLGIKTVWVSTNTGCPPYVDVKISSILDLPRRIRSL